MTAVDTEKAKKELSHHNASGLTFLRKKVVEYKIGYKQLLRVILPMDRSTLEDCLSQTEQQIAEGLETIAEQRAVIANLDGKRCYSRAAEELLKECESLQARLLTNRGLLLEALANLDDHQGQA